MSVDLGWLGVGAPRERVWRIPTLIRMLAVLSLIPIALFGVAAGVFALMALLANLFAR